MIQEWLELKELLNVAGLPSTVQGVTKKAKLENWERRLIKGRKGKTYEYHYSSLPQSVQRALGFGSNEVKEININTKTDKENLIEVNKARFLTAISTLEEILTMTRKTMAPEAKAQMVWMIYELLSEKAPTRRLLI